MDRSQPSAGSGFFISPACGGTPFPTIKNAVASFLGRTSLTATPGPNCRKSTMV